MSEEPTEAGTPAAGDAGTEPRPAELSREMTLFHAVMIGVGAMIGAGIFVLTGTAAGVAGPGLILAFALNGFIALLTAFSYAELGSCFPEAGGGYLWVKEGLPQPNGFLSGWMSWFAHAVACSLYALAFGAFAAELLAMAGFATGPHDAFNAWAMKGFAVAACAAFTWINFRGAGETGTAEALVTIAKMIVIALFLVTGAVAFLRATPESLARFGDFLPMGMGGVLVAMGYTFIAFEGYEIIAQCGEELKDPKRNIPRSIFISMAVVVPIYILVAIVAIGAVDSGDLPSWVYLGQKGELAMIRAADDFMVVKGLGAVVFLIGGIFSTMSALNATIYSSSRVSFAMGRDRNLPAAFGRIHPKRRTPAVALIVSSAFIVVMAVALPIEDVASATDVMFLFLFIFVNAALINLRRHRPDLDRGFRVPFVPWLPLVAIASNVLIAGFLFWHYPTGIPIVGGYILVGVGIYFAYARRQERAQFAQRTLFETAPASTKGDRILVPIANPRSTPGLMRLARVLAFHLEKDIVVLNAVRLPVQTPLSSGTGMLEEARRILAEAVAIRLPEAVSERLDAVDRLVGIQEVAKLCHRIPAAIVETIVERKAGMVILGWRGKERRRDFFFGNVLDETVMNAPCHVVMLSRPDRAVLDSTKRVLAPFITPRHSALSFRISLAVARAAGAPAVFLHIVRPGLPEPVADVARRLTRETAELLGVPEDAFTVRVVEAGNPKDTILLERRAGDLLVLGASEEGLVRRAFFGDMAESIGEQIPDPVLFVKRYPGHVKSWFQQVLGSRRPQLSDLEHGS